MKKLKNKIFLLLLIILTLFSLTLVFVFNYSYYQREYNDIRGKLNRIELSHKNYFFSIDEINRIPMFLDSVVYLVAFDSDFNISAIVSYTDSGLNNLEIQKLALDYIGSNKYKNKKIGNLYFSKYIYSFNKSNNLIIIDNEQIRSKLGSILRLSVVLFVLIEGVIVYLSIVLTRWITKPVMESFDKQKQFIYDASHELKTPIAVIMANADVLEGNSEQEKWINNIKTESERMSKLVTDLLDLAKSDDVSSSEAYELNDLSSIVYMGALTFESLVYEKGLKLDCQIADGIMFKCNSDRMKQLIAILIDNAIKHSYEKSKIKVKLAKDGDSIVLEVINKGEVIAIEDREKIFERFYRVDSSRNRDDNRYGLGLAIAKNIVLNHGGLISVNCLGGYTTFRVCFKKI